MIVESLINMLFLSIGGLLNFLPPLDLHIESVMFNNFLEVVRLAGYLLPIKTIILIVTMIISLQIFTIVMALIRLIWWFIRP